MKFPGSTLGGALNAYPVTTGGVELAIRKDVFHEQFVADVPAATKGGSHAISVSKPDVVVASILDAASSVLARAA